MQICCVNNKTKFCSKLLVKQETFKKSQATFSNTWFTFHDVIAAHSPFTYFSLSFFKTCLCGLSPLVLYSTLKCVCFAFGCFLRFCLRMLENLVAGMLQLSPAIIASLRLNALKLKFNKRFWVMRREIKILMHWNFSWIIRIKRKPSRLLATHIEFSKQSSLP